MLIRARPARAVVFALLALGLHAASADPQEPEGSAAGRLAGAAIGLAAGALAGNVGSILPCTQTSLGNRCVGAATFFGGAIGLGSGLVVGGADQDAVNERAGTALVGFAIGSAIGIAGWSTLPRIGLADILTVGAVGGALGTQPEGALAGAAIGGALGVVLWSTVPAFEAPDIVTAVLAGTAVGVLAAWIGAGVDASHSAAPSFTITWVP